MPVALTLPASKGLARSCDYSQSRSFLGLQVPLAFKTVSRPLAAASRACARALERLLVALCGGQLGTPSAAPCVSTCPLVALCCACACIRVLLSCPCAVVELQAPTRPQACHPVVQCHFGPVPIPALHPRLQCLGFRCLGCFQPHCRARRWWCLRWRQMWPSWPTTLPPTPAPQVLLLQPQNS
jgi:hypothetical protein